MHQRALLEALEVIPEVDAAYAEAVGRSWGGLTWGHLLEDADVLLHARQGHVKLFCEVCDGGVSPTKELKHSAPGHIREGRKGGIKAGI